VQVRFQTFARFDPIILPLFQLAILCWYINYLIEYLIFQVEAGQYCTFVVHCSGEVNACGKGSYGRLGLGDSNNQPTPKKVMFDVKIKKLSSSKGSDGHSLALSEDGQVYSWGDGKNYN
jgi:hypothetical protein